MKFKKTYSNRQLQQLKVTSTQTPAKESQRLTLNKL
jgi:hypothetical protein